LIIVFSMKGNEMFLHLIEDEKFMSEMIALFKRCDPGNHQFVIMKQDAQCILNHLNGVENVSFIQWQSQTCQQLQTKLSNYTAVFIHGLFNPCYVELVKKASPEAVFVWVFWGGELLLFDRYRSSLLLLETRLLRLKHRAFPWLAVNFRKYGGMIRQGQFYQLIQSLFGLAKRTSAAQVSNLATNLKDAIKRMNYIIPIIEDDFFLLQKMFSPSAKRLTWNYSVGISLDRFKQRQVSKKNWLVGNSAHYTNNHIEIFRQLRKIKKFDAKIIVPLSYGDLRYRETILRTGRRFWPDRFAPLLEFMPRDRYCDLINTCSCAFFNTRRQQAMGNIVLLLSLGVKIFLREENPAYRFLKRNELAIFSIQENISPSSVEVFEPLSEGTVESNRNILRRLYGESAQWHRTMEMLNELKEKSGK